MEILKDKTFDVIIIGGGQSGLAVAYYLRRTKLNYCILDQNRQPGGSWSHYWDSLRLFSPASWSSLPGILFPGGTEYYPTRNEALKYFEEYERKYNFPKQYSVKVERVVKKNNSFTIHTNQGKYSAKAIVSATGSFLNPSIPPINGMNVFNGKILHSSEYKIPAEFKDKKVAVVGEGNSGAQIMADVSSVANTYWITSKKPKFLPNHVDGRYLFDAATQLYEAKKAGIDYTPPSLGDIVMVPPVKRAFDNGILKDHPPIKEIRENSILLKNNIELEVDAIIFCTGFKPALNHLDDLKITEKNGRIITKATKAIKMNGVWLVGYGNWTGFASATIIGVGRSARETVKEIENYLIP